MGGWYAGRVERMQLVPNHLDEHEKGYVRHTGRKSSTTTDPGGARGATNRGLPGGRRTDRRPRICMLATSITHAGIGISYDVLDGGPGVLVVSGPGQHGPTHLGSR